MGGTTSVTLDGGTVELEPTIDTELAPTGDVPEVTVGSSDDALVEDELLVEEISIDGMCGVY